MAELAEKIGKKKHEYDAMRRNLMDSLEGMAQESEQILQKIYEAIGNRSNFEIDDDTKIYSNGVQIDDHIIYCEPEKTTRMKEEIVQRTGLAKTLFGPEKKKIIKEEVPTGHLKIAYDYDHTVYGDDFRSYTFGNIRDKKLNLVELAEKIKEKGSVEDAKEFAELNKRIRELPSQIVEHLDKRSKELESARSLGSVKDVDKLDYIKADCRYCGAPNPDLKSVCGHCGHKAYEIPKKVKHN